MFINKFFKFFVYFGRGYEFKMLYMLFMAFMTSLLEFLSIVLVFPFIMIMVNPGRVVNNPVAIFLQTNLNITNTNHMIFIIGSMIAGIIIIKNLYSIFILYLQNKIISKWGLEIKEKILECFLYSPYEADLKNGNNNVIAKVTQDVDDVMQYFVFKVINFISNSMVIVLVFSILMFLLPVVTLIAVLFFTIAGCLQSNIFRAWGQKLSNKKYTLTHGSYNMILNSLNYVKDIKINGCQKYFYDCFDNVSEKIIPLNEKINLIPLIPQYIIEIIFIFTMIILCTGIFAKYGEDPSNILVTMGVVAIAIYRIIPQIYKNQVYLNYISLYSNRVDELFKLYDEYKIYDYSLNKNTKEKIEFYSDILINNLSYSYDKKTNVLQNINLDIKKGEFIGIVGLSGAGKSTLVDCLLGLLQYEGDIYIDNTLLSIDNVQKFRNIIGYVPQKINTTEGDIYTNVAWGVERKDINKEKADSVLKTAQLYDQLKQTENGLEIELKQNGSGLSGGQMQRIGIARALYREPEILVFDEATSNLDVKIENKITEILSELKGDKTIIAIAHRLSTLVNCDRIAYLKDGTIVDVGTFKELCSKYKDFEEIVKLSRIKLDDDNNDNNDEKTNSSDEG